MKISEFIVYFVKTVFEMAVIVGWGYFLIWLLIL
jgi:hypothetical protein